MITPCRWSVIHDDSRTRDEWGRIYDQTIHQYLSHFAALWHNLSCWDADVFNTSSSTRNYLKANWDDDEKRALNIADRCVSCTNEQSTLTDPLHHACSTNKEKNKKGRLADGIRQRTGRDDLDRYHTWRNLITLLDLCVSSPHCLPINRHITQ